MAAGTLQNGAATFLIVHGFTGDTTTDIDTDNDGVEDVPFPGTIDDRVATGRPSQGDRGYFGWGQMLGPDTGPDGTDDFDPAGLARCPDCDGEWSMICLAGSEGDPVCLDNNPDGLYTVSHASPCEINPCPPPVSVESSSWGVVKGEYR